jgi:hypothetical protein
MKIHEIIIESQELEEGWKSKLGAAALAGAAALGGGGSDAQAQNYQPTTQSQQAPAKWHNFLNDPNGTYGTIGMLTPYYKAGKLSKADSDLYNKMLRAFDQERQVNPNLNTDAINKYFGEKYSSSQQILNKYANTPNKDFSPFTSQPIQTLRMLDKWLQQAEQAEQAERAYRMTNPKNSKYGDTIVDEVPLSEPWQKYYTTITNDMKRDISATKNELAKPLTPDQKIAFKKQIDSAISTFVKGPNGLEAAEKAGLNKDAVKILNRQLDQLKSLSSSIKP